MLFVHGENEITFGCLYDIQSLDHLKCLLQVLRRLNEPALDKIENDQIHLFQVLVEVVDLGNLTPSFRLEK